MQVMLPEHCLAIRHVLGPARFRLGWVAIEFRCAKGKVWHIVAT